MLTLAGIVTDLGFLLAIDHCARGCAHCPAFGDRTPVQRAPLPDLARTVKALAAARRTIRTTDRRVVHCWRISDPLDYVVRLADGRIGTCADVAELWRTHLGQGLYVVTNGSEASPIARRALAQLVDDSGLTSQLKLTITHADRHFGTPRYTPQLAADVAILEPLWKRDSTRIEDVNGRRFRINVKTTASRKAEMRAVLHEVLIGAGLSRAQAVSYCDDPTRVRFKPIYDLGDAAGASSPVAGALDVRRADGRRHKPTGGTRRQMQFGIRPDRRLFVVDMYAFTEHDLGDDDQPLIWPEGLDGIDLHAPLKDLTRA
ncbi:hypothetical protein [Actinoplanes couchii]|uniref:Radical SAM domain protein n=1 Tax=Actinoplanes couchii TaxID=403638 RepID=A0ABQ3XLA1_9ACTN|nr:hypothetical protein [Actinoplanes couchii]MDR6318378.1 hypothetical protein [Actinoplanes couchii]GID59255.1 hypothetical protein Aco03nite_076590 [Actinoplanes couchii]